MGGRKRNKDDKKKNWDTGVPTQEYFNELFRVSKNQIIWGGSILSCHVASILWYGIRERQCTGEILLSVSWLGLEVEGQGYTKRILIN